MNDDPVTTGGLQVARALHDFATQRALPGSGVEPGAFWAGLETLLRELAPTNATLLARRDQSPVLVRQGHLMAATFHPELSSDRRVHQLFVELVRTHQSQTPEAYPRRQPSHSL